MNFLLYCVLYEFPSNILSLLNQKYFAMKLLRSILVLVGCVIIINSCKKELIDQNNLLSEGSLAKTATGNCSPISLGGMFLRNSALTINNYMDVQVNFVSIGTYTIKSDTINGYSFQGIGQVSITGLSTIRLQGSGTPIAAGTNVFTISFGTSTCQTNVVVSLNSSAFTLGNAQGSCTGAAMSGTFTAGTALNATNTAAIQVNVSTTGAYTISSDNVNGIIFSASGSFATTGPQTVLLTGNGSPTTAGSFTYHVGTTGNCTFVLAVTSATGNLATLTTTPVSGILCTSALSGGNITNDGGTAITARGICIATSHNPIIGQGTTVNGTGIGIFTSNVGSLIVNTTYYLRAYATNSAGTAYGNELAFTTTATCPPVTIYIAGYEDIYDISGNIRTPKVWKRTGGSFTGTYLPISNASGIRMAHSIFATTNDVYVAGLNAGSAELWKNNLNGPLAGGSFGAAYSVFVSGTDIYAAGQKSGGLAVLWKNGNMSTLGVIPGAGSGSQSSYAQSVYVSGNDVYVAGQQQNTTGQYLATVWKNGVPLYLSDGTAAAEATSVFVNGNDVYVCGTDNNQAKLWKNGISLTLSNTWGASSAKSVFVSGTDVYVAGIIQNGTSPDSYATLWKNGTPTFLTAAGYHNWAQSVFVKGTDVYVVGTKDSFFANSVATIWINGFATPLTSGSTDANALSVFVQ
jgi:hypothetical protein